MVLLVTAITIGVCCCRRNKAKTSSAGKQLGNLLHRKAASQTDDPAKGGMGSSECPDAELRRHSVARWLVLTSALVYRDISMKVRDDWLGSFRTLKFIAMNVERILMTHIDGDRVGAKID